MYNIKGGFLFGHGYNSVWEMFSGVMRIGSNAYAMDAQNAFLEYWLYFGVLGVVSLVALILVVFGRQKQYMKYDFRKKTYYALSGLYILVLLGTIEITINMVFYCFLSLIAVLSCADNDVSKGEKE